jgi:hypothetical protein
MASFGGALVLFGGSGVELALDDTWKWDGSVWTKRREGDGPGGGAYGSAVANVGHTLLLFGGKTDVGEFYLGSVDAFGSPGTTWQWDGQSWNDLGHDWSGPAPRERAVLVSY